ncbi:MAG: hypothetical protein GY805_33505 [Chloroflexi bacterium]|nr:hypothetical protein [Chloroflexota bacterium]
MDIPQRRFLIWFCCVGSFSYLCIPYPAAVTAVSSHRTHRFIHCRQSPNALWRRGKDQAVFTEILARLLGFMPVCSLARPSGAVGRPDERDAIAGTTLAPCCRGGVGLGFFGN